MGKSNTPRFAVTCPYCSTKLKVGDRDLGTTRKCPSCQEAFVLPAKRAAEHAAAKREFSFLCQLCYTRLYATPDQIGQPLPCPDCDSVNTVPKPIVAPIRKPFVSPGDDYALRPLNEAADSQTTAIEGVRQFRITCGVCNASLYFGVDQVGSQQTCPDCGIQLRVPKAPPEPKKAQPPTADPNIQIEPPARPRVTQTSTVASTMEKARARVIEKAERDELPPIKNPFRDGVWTFPLTLSGLPYCIVASFSLCLILTLLVAAAEMDGIGMVVGLFIWLFAGIGFMALVLLSAVYWMTVVSWTAMGHKSIKQFPPIEMFSWIRTALFIVNAGGMSVAPGALIAAIIPVFPYRSLLALPSMFLFFSVILMSMLDDDSPVSLYTHTIHDSLSRCTSAWIKFYAIAGLLSVFLAIPHVMGFFFDDPFWLYAAAVTLVIGSTVYFRVFGRLAWVINETMVIESEEEPDDFVAPPPLMGDLRG